MLSILIHPIIQNIIQNCFIYSFYTNVLYFMICDKHFEDVALVVLITLSFQNIFQKLATGEEK